MQEGFSSSIPFCLVFICTGHKVLVMPKKILHDIEQIYRNFLWHGVYFSAKPGNIAWHIICEPKSTGGLGIRQIQMWNKAAIANYFLAISTKQYNLWIKWIHVVYVKDTDWWMYNHQIVQVGIGNKFIS